MKRLLLALAAAAWIVDAVARPAPADQPACDCYLCTINARQA